MYKLFICCCLLSSFSYCQEVKEIDLENNPIIYVKSSFPRGWGDKDKYGKSIETHDVLYDLTIKVLIQNVNNKTVIDFNNFSLLDTDNKIRYQVLYANFFNYYISSVKLKDFTFSDRFSEFSQSGYEDYILYKFKRNSISVRTDESYQMRVQPTVMPRKKQKNIKFNLIIPVKNKHYGDFILLYKNKVIKEFKIEK